MSTSVSTPECRGFPDELRATLEPLGHLGAGGMGAVYLARDRKLGREVAVKLMHGSSEQDLRTRFLREASSLARLEHPNIVRVYDYGVCTEGPYIVMERLDGGTLEALPAGADPVEVMLQVAEGLDAIHQAGMVHRDLKPTNVLVTADARAVIVDFGLVMDPKRTKLTREGAFVGTFMVAAPEVLRMQPATAASDWWSWGATFFQLLEGSFPYTLADLLVVTEGREPGPPEFEVTPPDSLLAKVIRAALTVDPAARLSSARAARAMLEDPASTRPLPQAPPRPPRREVSASKPGADSRRTHPLSPGSDLLSSVLSDRRKAGAGVLGVLLALAGAGLLLRGPGAVDPPAPSAPPLEVALPEGIQEDLARQRTDLLQAPGDLLDGDPVHAEGLLRRLPALQEILTWAAQGGDLGALSPALRADLARTDQALHDAGGPRLVYPLLEAAPLPQSVALPARLQRIEYRTADLPSTVTGWMATGMLAMDRAMELQERLQAELYSQAGGPPAGFAPELWAARPSLLAGSPTLLEFVRLRSHDPAFRRGLARWLEPGSDQVRLALYAVHRSLAEEPRTREPLGLLVSYLRGEMSSFFYGPQAFLPIDLVFGGPGRHPTQQFWRANMLLISRLVRTRVGLPRRNQLQEAELAAWRAAAVRTAGDRSSDLRAGSALASGMRTALGPPVLLDEALDFYRQQRPRLASVDPINRGQAFLCLARMVVEASGRAGLTPEERAQLGAGLAEVTTLEAFSTAERDEARRYQAKLEVN